MDVLLQAALQLKKEEEEEEEEEEEGGGGGGGGEGRSVRGRRSSARCLRCRTIAAQLRAGSHPDTHQVQKEEEEDFQKLLPYDPLPAAFVVDNGSIMCLTAYAGSVLLTLCPLFWVVRTRRTYMLWPRPWSTPAVACAMLVLLVVFSLRCPPFFCR